MSTQKLINVYFCLHNIYNEIRYMQKGGVFMDLGNKVKQRRIELNMTQDELAKKMGYNSRSSINKIENGRPVGQSIIMRLADALDTDISYLMGWDSNEYKEIEKTISKVLKTNNREIINEDKNKFTIYADSIEKLNKLKCICNVLNNLSVDELDKVLGMLNVMFSCNIKNEHKKSAGTPTSTKNE